jgi:hypothetical protein
MPHIANNTDDLPRVIFVDWPGLVAQHDLLTDRIFIGKVFQRKCLIDEHCPDPTPSKNPDC